MALVDPGECYQHPRGMADCVGVDVETVTRACLWCQSDLSGRHWRTKYCNQSCRERYAYLQAHPIVERSCGHCGTDISSKKRHAVYCSRSCKSMAAERRLRTSAEAGRRRNLERYKKERAKRRAYARQQYRDNREAQIEYSRAWRRANPDRRQVQSENRRARKVGNPGYVIVTIADWLSMCRRHSHRCAYCGKRPDRLVMDHVVPLSRGGRHSSSNILPACPPCNGSKAAMFLSEWRLGSR